MDSFITDLLLAGRDNWNTYRAEHPEFGGDTGCEPDEPLDKRKKRTQKIARLCLEKMDLSGYDFTEYDFRNVTFLDCECRGARFESTVLDMATFRGTCLEDAFFCRTTFATTFEGCRMAKARFSECDGSMFVGSRWGCDGAIFEKCAIEFVCVESVPLKGGISQIFLAPLRLLDGTLVPDDSTLMTAAAQEVDPKSE